MVRLEFTMKEFFADGGNTKFVDRVAGSLGTVVFSMADDHLKARDPDLRTGISVDSVGFNIWLLRSW